MMAPLSHENGPLSQVTTPLFNRVELVMYLVPVEVQLAEQLGAMVKVPRPLR